MNPWKAPGLPGWASWPERLSVIRMPDTEPAAHPFCLCQAANSPRPGRTEFLVRGLARESIPTG